MGLLIIPTLGCCHTIPGRSLPISRQNSAHTYVEITHVAYLGINGATVKIVTF